MNFAHADFKKHSRRYFTNKHDEIDLDKITYIAGPYAVLITPFDVDEDGRMDILVERKMPN